MEKTFKIGIALAVLGLILAVPSFLNLVFAPPLDVPSAYMASTLNGFTYVLGIILIVIGMTLVIHSKLKTKS
jgi:hypothetical protein